MKPSISSSKKRGKKQRKSSSPSPPQSAALSSKPHEHQQQFEADEEERVQSRAPEVKKLADDEEEKKRAVDVDWLMEAFSSLSLDQICCAYNEAGHDPFKAAGILGAQLIDPEEADSAEVEIEIKEERKQNKKKKGTKKHKRVAAATGIVADVIGKGYVKPYLNSAIQVKADDINGRKDKVEDGDRQYSVEEGEEFLCSMLGDDAELGMGVVKDVLGQCGYNVEKALDALLEISASSFNKLKAINGGNHSRLYPDDSSDAPPESSLNSFQPTDKSKDLAYHPSGKENDFLQYVGRGCREESGGFGNSVKQLPHRARDVNLDLQQKVLESLFSLPDCPTHDPSSMNWKEVVKQVESLGQELAYFNASITEPLLNARNGKEDEYNVCRSVARKHWDIMKTYYQKAATAYARGERADAAYLSEKGRFYSKLARKADENASREIFQARNKNIRNTVTIDLHGQHVKQGIGLLKLHLLLLTYIPSIQFLKVITGWGADTATRGKLKRSVISLVKKEGIKWSEENSGSILLGLDGAKYSFMEEDGNDPDDKS